MFDEPKDIFAETEKPSAVPPPPMPDAPVAPIAPPPTQLPPTYGAMNQPPAPSMDSGHRGGGLKIVIIVGVILVIFGVSGFFAYRIMVQPTDSSSVVNSVPDTGVISDTPLDTKPITPGAPLPEASAPVPATPVKPVDPASLLDTDGDGLTNARELELGTSVTKSDTDGDGLGDKEEVDVYGTNPRKVDTDGDGFLDGQEVQGGYNPNGPGKLFTIPTEPVIPAGS